MMIFLHSIVFMAICSVVIAYSSVAHIPARGLIYKQAKKQQLPFVILIASYNTERVTRDSVLSALNQSYDNYRIIYHDDGSTDANVLVVRALAQEHPKGHLIELVCNEKRRGGPLANHYESITQRCHDEEIIVILDGDGDELAHADVLKVLNFIYSDSDVWLTYGQFKEKHSGRMGFCCPMPPHITKNNAFRRWQHGPSHLRTFKVWLFKAIKKEHLLYNGEFFTMTGDLAQMLPMIEMARDHFRFIPEVLYVYNERNPFSEHCVNKQFQQTIDRYVRSLPVYTPLQCKPLLC